MLVEVGELLERHEQDLGQLMESVTAGKSTRRASMAPERGGTPAGARFATPAPVRRQPSHASSGTSRPLSSLLGTPSGHHGRALLPITSPFEDRQNVMRQASETPEPTNKRRKIDAVPPRKEPLWTRTPKAQSGIGNENAALGRQMSHANYIPPPAKVRKAYEKPAKAGYTQKLAPTVLTLSGSGPQKSRPTPARQPIGNGESESDDDVVMVGSRPRSPNASARPKVNLKEIFHRASSKLTREVVYPDSIAPARKERKEYEKPPTAGYAQKLAPAVLNLSSSKMSNLHARRRNPTREETPELDMDDATETLSSGSRHRPMEVEDPPTKKQTAILPPSKILQPVARQVVYPDSIPPKKKARKAYERMSKEGYASKLTGASLNLSGATAIKPSTRAKIDDSMQPLGSDDEDEIDVDEAALSPPVPMRGPSRKKANEASRLATQMRKKKKDALLATIFKNANATNLKAENEATAAPLNVVQEKKESPLCTQPDDFVDLDEIMPQSASAMLPPGKWAKSVWKSKEKENETITEREEEESPFLLGLDASTPNSAVVKPARGMEKARKAQLNHLQTIVDKNEAAPRAPQPRLTLKERMLASARKQAGTSPSVTCPAQKTSPFSAAPSPADEASRASSVGSGSAENKSQTSVPQVMGSLRIKSKPKRKMLMMQQSLRSRSATPQERLVAEAPPAKKAKVLKPQRKAAEAEVVLVDDPASLEPQPRVSTKSAPPDPSQATMELQDFQSKQKEKLVARKKKIEQKKKDSAIEVMSSPPEEQQEGRSGSPDWPGIVDEEDDHIVVGGDDDMGIDAPSSPVVFGEAELINLLPRAVKQTVSRPATITTTKKAVLALRNAPYTLNSPAARPDDKESGNSYTTIDNLLHSNPTRPLSRFITAPSASSPAKKTTKRPEPSQTVYSSPAFTQFSQREKIPLPVFSSEKVGPIVATTEFRQYLNRSRIVPPSSFLGTQASQYQAQGSQAQPPTLEPSWRESPTPVARVQPAASTRLPVSTFPSTEPDSQRIRSAVRRQARIEKSPSPSAAVVPGDDSSPGISSPRRERPRVASNSDMENSFVADDDYSSAASGSCCPRNPYLNFQSEETDDDDSDGDGRDWRRRELSMIEEEQLKSGQPILVKIKSGIRSKEIIRPKRVMTKRKPSVVYRYEKSPGSDSPEHRDNQENRYEVSSSVVYDEDGMDVLRKMESVQGSRSVVAPSYTQDDDDAMQALWEAETDKPKIRSRQPMMGPPPAARKASPTHVKGEAPSARKTEVVQSHPKLESSNLKSVQPFGTSKPSAPESVEREVDVVPATEPESVVKMSPTQSLDKASQEPTVVIENVERTIEKTQAGKDAKVEREQREAKITLQKEAGEETRLEALEQETKARFEREAIEVKTRRTKEAQETLEEGGLLEQQADEKARLLKLQTEANGRLEAEEARKKARLLKLKQDDDARQEVLKAEEVARLERQRVEEARIAKQEADQNARLKALEENESRIQRMEAEQKARLQKQEAEERAMRLKAEEARVKKVKEELEEKDRKEKLEVDAQAQRDKEGLEEKARKESLEAEEKLRRERHAFRVPSLRKGGGSGSGSAARQPAQILALQTLPSSEDGSSSTPIPQPTISSYKAPIPRPPPSHPASIGPRTQALMQEQPPPSSIDEEIACRGREEANLVRMKSLLGDSYVPPDMSSAGSSFAAPLVLTTPAVRPFKAPKSVPIVERPKTMAEVRNDQWAERERERRSRENLVYWPGKEELGKIGEWEEGAWTAEAGDLFDWKPMVGDEVGDLA